MSNQTYRSKRFQIGTRANAVYRESDELLYRHNCYIEALPAVRTPEEVASLVARYPAYDPKERGLPALHRLNAVSRIEKCIFPMPDFLITEQKISRMIRSGYFARNPMEAEWRRQMLAGFPSLSDKLADDGATPFMRSAASSMAIIGQSGVGKSTLIEGILGLYPQIIVHTQYNGTPFDQHQLVWLKLECPFDASLRGLCVCFFETIDDILGTRYAVEYCGGGRRKTADDLLPIMSRLAANLGLGVLVIDEIQRLSQAHSGGPERMLNFFVELTNKFGVPVVLIGTYKALSLFTKDFAMARRAAGQGDVMISNLKQDEYWDHFLGKLWKYQWTNVPTPLTKQLSETIYNESQGIVDIAVKLYMLTQWSVIGENDERLTPARIREVAKDNFHAVRPILRALRGNDIDALAKIGDILPQAEHLENFLSSASKRVILSGMMDTLSNQEQPGLVCMEELLESPESQVAKLLIGAGHPIDLAQRWAHQAVQRFAFDSDIRAATSEAFRLATESLAVDEVPMSAVQNKTKKPAKVISLSSDLREITKSALKKNESVYDALNTAGVIKPATEFLDRTAA